MRPVRRHARRCAPKNSITAACRDRSELVAACRARSPEAATTTSIEVRMRRGRGAVRRVSGSSA